MNDYLAELNATQAGMIQKAPEGAFTDVQKAMDALQEARSAVGRLADELVGEEPNSEGQMKAPEKCGGALGELSLSASSARAIARDIISNVERIRRHAN